MEELKEKLKSKKKDYYILVKHMDKVMEPRVF